MVNDKQRLSIALRWLALMARNSEELDPSPCPRKCGVEVPILGERAGTPEAVLGLEKDRQSAGRLGPGF